MCPEIVVALGQTLNMLLNILLVDFDVGVDCIRTCFGLGGCVHVFECVFVVFLVLICSDQKNKIKLLSPNG